MKKGYRNKRKSRSTPTSPINGSIASSTSQLRSSHHSTIAPSVYTPSLTPRELNSLDVNSIISSPLSPTTEYNLKELSVDLSLPPKVQPEEQHNVLHSICDRVLDYISNKDIRRCNLVQLVKEDMLKMKLHFTSFFGHLKELNGKLLAYENMSTPPSRPSFQPTFSDIVKSNNKEKIIIIENKTQEEKPIQALLSSKNTSTLPKPIDIVQIKNKKKFIVKHSSMRKTEEYFEQIKDLNNEDLKITMETPKNNKVILFNIPIELTDEELKKELNEDDALNDEDYEIIKHFNSSVSSKNLVLAVNNQANETLLNRGRILIKYHSIRIQKFKIIKRCFHCQGFGHYSSSCRFKEKCGKCSQDHDTRSCISNLFKCVNCSGSHPSYSNQCHKYREYKKRILDRA